MIAKPILLAALAIGATAAPPHDAAAPVVQRAIATCTTGAPPSNPTFDINYLNVSQFLPSGLSDKNYEPDRAWAAQHALHTTYLGLRSGGGMDDYAAFKCQYSCNGEQGCVSYFGRYVQAGSNTEHFDCITYDALLDESLFVEDTEKSNIAVGGFDKLCVARKA